MSELIFVRRPTTSFRLLVCHDSLTHALQVTGASGFLGSHVVLQLLEKGYRVRAAVRGAKVEQLKSSYASYGERFEVVPIADIVRDQFPEALVGVHAIIHTACMLPGRAEPAKLLAAAEEGTLNVVVQGEKAGVKKIVITSSIATVINPQFSCTDQGTLFLFSHWNPITKEAGLTCGIPLYSYAAAKKFAELALWAWADEHPHVDVTTLNPTYFYGPLTPHFALPEPSFLTLSSNLIFYNYLFPDGVFPPQTLYTDVRDGAAAHVRALSAPPTAEVGRKRLLLSSPHGWPFTKTIEFIAAQRPALAGRLITAVGETKPVNALPMDFARLEQVLGMTVADFHTIEQTTLETVDALVKLENQWKDVGFAIETPPAF
ncbi:hypothetical protein C8R44DRAFT_934354 [Mycena epipterygia]|nr:hypothetical protein C8R44DRAFT_934354 [Mycena epipterygia]